MSVLETPRILFKGEIAWDPIVTNNYREFYDEGTADPVFPDAVDRVKAFRQEAIGAVVARNWNPHGTHRSVFYDSSISGVDLGAGVTTNDPFVTSAANFTGMLVDLEPYGTLSSQIFFDTIRFGIDGGYRILGKRRTRFTARYINFGRNPSNSIKAGVASVIWQTTFAKAEGLRIDAFDSPALLALQAALADDDVLGLTVRFNTYRTMYYDNIALSNGSQLLKDEGTALTAKLNGGGFQPNPARSMMIGVIGLWRKGEPEHEPGDRAILPVDPTSPVGGAYARLAGNTLTLDLGNSIPEADRVLTKTDLGPLNIAVAGATGTTNLGTLIYAQYNRGAYEASSGIVTVPLTPQQAQAASSGDLQLQDSQGNVLIAEVGLRALPAVPNLYLDEGTSTTAVFQVYNRGLPAKGPLPVTVYRMSADGNTIENSIALNTDAYGVLTLPLAATTGGIYAYVAEAVPGMPPPTGGINPQLNTYMYFRTLPANAQIGQMTPSWENVYVNVLANWNAMAPCMDNWLMLDDPVQVKRFAPTLRRLVDPANFESFLFMPVTRDMTLGERTLLLRFLDTPGEGKAAKLAAPPAAIDFVQLNRSMRD